MESALPLEPSPAPIAPESRSAILQRDVRLAALCGILNLALYRVSASVSGDGIALIALFTLADMFLILLFAVCFARILNSWRSLIAGLAVTGVSVALLALPALYSLRKALPGLGELAMVALAVCGGVLVSRLFREMKMLLPAAVMLALVDLYVVFGGGLVAQATSGRSQAARDAMKALTVNLPTPQAREGASPIQLAVGFADYLFIAVFFACFHRFGIPARKTFCVLTGLLVLYMFAVALTEAALPALVPMAVVVIAMNWRHFRYDAEEKKALLAAGAIVAVLFVGLLWRSRR